MTHKTFEFWFCFLSEFLFYEIFCFPLAVICAKSSVWEFELRARMITAWNNEGFRFVKFSSRNFFVCLRLEAKEAKLCYFFVLILHANFHMKKGFLANSVLLLSFRWHKECLRIISCCFIFHLKWTNSSLINKEFIIQRWINDNQDSNVINMDIWSKVVAENKYAFSEGLSLFCTLVFGLWIPSKL